MDRRKGLCIGICVAIVLAILIGGVVWGTRRFVKNNSFDASKSILLYRPNLIFLVILHPESVHSL